MARGQVQDEFAVVLVEPYLVLRVRAAGELAGPAVVETGAAGASITRPRSVTANSATARWSASSDVTRGTRPAWHTVSGTPGLIRGHALAPRAGKLPSAGGSSLFGLCRSRQRKR